MIKKTAVAFFAKLMASSAAAGGMAIGVSSSIEQDPIPWAIGAAGATVVYAYKKPETRIMAV